MTKMIQQPSVGRIVHYTNLGDKDGKYPPQIVAAIITAVGAGPDAFDVKLAVLYATGVFFMPDGVKYTDEPAGSDRARGKWTWPAFVAPLPVREEEELPKQLPLLPGQVPGEPVYRGESNNALAATIASGVENS